MDVVIIIAYSYDNTRINLTIFCSIIAHYTHWSQVDTNIAQLYTTFGHVYL